MARVIRFHVVTEIRNLNNMPSCIRYLHLVSLLVLKGSAICLFDRSARL